MKIFFALQREKKMIYGVVRALLYIYIRLSLLLFA